MLIAELAEALQEARGCRQHAAFALDGLDDHRRHVAAHLGPHRLDIAEGDVHHAVDRAEALAVLRGASHGQGAHGAPVERVVERDDLRTLLLALRVRSAPRELEDGLVRLGARVAEERAIEAGFRAQLVSEEDVLLVVEVVRDVHQARGLLGDGLRERGMRVPDRAHGNAGAEIEIAASFDVEELTPLTAREDDRSRFVVRVETLRRDREELDARGHGGDRGLYSTRDTRENLLLHLSMVARHWSTPKIQIRQSGGTSQGTGRRPRLSS